MLWQQRCVCSKWNFRLGLRERLLRIAVYRCMQCRTPATAVQLLLHVQDSAESACSVCTGYVFFGTLVGNCNWLQILCIVILIIMVYLERCVVGNVNSFCCNWTTTITHIYWVLSSDLNVTSVCDQHQLACWGYSTQLIKFIYMYPHCSVESRLVNCDQRVCTRLSVPHCKGICIVIKIYVIIEKVIVTVIITVLGKAFN